MNLSKATNILWGKKSSSKDRQYLPLVVHLSDAAGIAGKLWNNWISEGVKRELADGLQIRNNPENKTSLEIAKDFLCFLAGVHDFGKATPAFQLKLRTKYDELDQLLFSHMCQRGYVDEEFSCDRFAQDSHIKHAAASESLLEHYGIPQEIACILGAHHGKPLDFEEHKESKVRKRGHDYYLTEYKNSVYSSRWKVSQDEILQFALLTANINCIAEVPIPNITAQILCSGLLIMIDWIASNEKLFPYYSLDDPLTGMRYTDENLRSRVETGWDKLGFTEPWIPDCLWMQDDYYEKRFSTNEFAFNPRPIQRRALAIAEEIINPGIMVIEAPMGQGKTEAALAVAEVFASISERSGLFFALPTQATSNGIFPRIRDWASKIDDLSAHSIRLAHGKSEFNQDYQSITHFNVNASNIDQTEGNSLLIHQWFGGRKTSLLADFVVGTVDQLLLMALRQKHVMLRHTGIANKVVIIDEIHAYDAYMSQYLEMALCYLGRYHVPVIMLSATLPKEKRYRLINAYLGKGLNLETMDDRLFMSHSLEENWVQSLRYPLITYTDGKDIFQDENILSPHIADISVERLAESDLLPLLQEKQIGGGCIGIVVNTVKKAQSLFDQIVEQTDAQVLLIHSKFVSSDRVEKERELLQLIGRKGNRPYKLIVIGTQVVEQSLDIDFDMLITEICPMDLLLQRVGRLHRHEHKRPQMLKNAQLFILSPDQLTPYSEGSKYIYGRLLLERTLALLPDRIRIPEDIPQLVQKTYDVLFSSFNIPEDYVEMMQEYKDQIFDKEEKAKI